MKRLVVLVTGMLLLSSTLFANGQQSDSTANEEKVSISWYMQKAGGKADQTHDDVYSYALAEEKTGVDQVWTHPEDDDKELNILLASGNIPDIITAEFDQYPGGHTKALACLLTEKNVVLMMQSQ